MEIPSYNKEIRQQILSYDPALRFHWNRQVNRWELWRQGRDKERFIVRVQNPDKSFRPIDNRLLSYLINNDIWRYKNIDAIERDLRDYEQRQEERKNARLEENLYERAKYYRKAFARTID